MTEKLQTQLSELDKLFDQLVESRQRAQQEVSQLLNLTSNEEGAN